MARITLGLLAGLGLAGCWAGSQPGSKPVSLVGTSFQSAGHDERGLWDGPPRVVSVAAADERALTGASRRLEPALFQVGQVGGDAGTAFLIARTRRLLATNAHVAEIFDEVGALVAVPSGGRHRYRVTRVWYHPEYRPARVRGVVLRGRPEPLHSRVVGPDIAVLELAGGGPELPLACRLAVGAESEPMPGWVVGKLGFAGPLAWRGSAPPPRCDVGAVEGVHAVAARWDLSRRWRLIEATTPMRHGESGGPLFLADGRVVGINAWGRIEEQASPGGRSHSVATLAVRIDALHELLVAHGLAPLPVRGDGPAD